MRETGNNPPPPPPSPLPTTTNRCWSVTWFALPCVRDKRYQKHLRKSTTFIQYILHSTLVKMLILVSLVERTYCFSRLRLSKYQLLFEDRIQCHEISRSRQKYKMEDDITAAAFAVKQELERWTGV